MNSIRESLSEGSVYRAGEIPASLSFSVSDKMTRLKTQIAVSPPRKPPCVGQAYQGDCPDWLRRLGDRIAGLRAEQARELGLYVKRRIRIGEG